MIKKNKKDSNHDGFGNLMVAPVASDIFHHPPTPKWSGCLPDLFQ